MNLLQVTHGLVEISAVHAGDVQISGGVAVITGRVTGNVDVWGGQAIIPGIVEGHVNNVAGIVRITGSVLGSITGSPAHTVVDITDRVTDPYGDWDPLRAARPAANPVITQARRPDLMAGRSSLVTALATAAVGLAIVGAVAVVGDNADVDLPGVSTVFVVDKPAG